MGSTDVSVIDGKLTDGAELRGGLIALVEGVLDVNDFKVQQRSAGANNSVDVLKGRACVVSPDTSQPTYHCPNYLVSQETDQNSASSSAFPLGNFAAPHATYSRLDQIIIRLYDNESGSRKWQLEIVQGLTPTQNATLDNRHNAGTLPPGVPCLKIADVVIPTSGVIGTAQIRDFRPWAHRDGQVGQGGIAFNGVAPPGWKLTEAQAAPRAQYSKLFAKVGTTWGAGDGSTTFNFPDSRGRSAFHPDGGVGRLTTDAANSGRQNHPNTLGSSGGQEKYKLSGVESGVNPNGIAASAGAHTHNSSADGPNFFYVEGGGGTDNFEFASGTDTLDVRRATNVTSSDGAHAHSLTVRTADENSDNMPPYFVAPYMIYTGMVS